MAEAFLDKKSSKSGLEIDGLIKEYYAHAGEEITAGSFVEFINGIGSMEETVSGYDTQISEQPYSGYSTSATLLPNNRIFIAHCVDYSKRCLYGIVCEINGTNITYGEDTQLNTDAYTGYTTDTITLSNGNVFIAHSQGSSSYYLYGTICEIDGFNITVKTSKQLVSGVWSGYRISMTPLPNGDIFLAHSSESLGYLYACVCKIDGFDITVGTDTSIRTVTNAGNRIKAITLNDGNVFIVHSNGSSYHVWGIVCEIDGTTITKGSHFTISNVQNAGKYLNATLLPNGHVFVMHSSDSNYRLVGVVCKIKGTTIIKGTAIDLSSNNNTSIATASVLLPNGKVFVAHPHQANQQINGTLVTIKGEDVITVGEGVIINTEAYPITSLSPVLLPNGDVLVIHNYGNGNLSCFLHGQVVGIDEVNNKPLEMGSVGAKYNRETQVKLATNPPFNGLALSSGEGGTETLHKDKIKIVVPTVGEDE